MVGGAVFIVVAYEEDWCHGEAGYDFCLTAVRTVNSVSYTHLTLPTSSYV